MADKIKYSIVVPAYSEVVVIEDSLINLGKALKTDIKRYYSTEVIVVTADSLDGTAALAKKHSDRFAHFRLIEPGKKVGKGRDVRAGMLAAQGEYILFTDADMATPPKHIAHAFYTLENGADVVIGVRPLSRVHNSRARRLRSVASNLLIRLLAVPGVSDTQCGFKGFTRSAAKELFKPLETLGWGFDIEILVRARARGFKIAKMTITDWYDPKIGAMGLAGESDLHANLKTLSELFKVAYKRLKRYYR